MSGRVVLRRDDQGLFRFNLLDEDGTVLSSSKGFDSVDAARDGAERARRLMAESELVDQTEGGNPAPASSEVADGG